MYIDSQNEFSDSQVVTATAVSTNVIELADSTIQQDIGTGEGVYAIVSIPTASSGGTSPTLTVTIESAENEALSTNAKVHFSTAALAAAAFQVAGKTLVCVRLPSDDYRRYLGVRYTVTGGPLTGGTVDAFLTKDPQKYRAYADAVTIAAGA